MYMPRGLHLPLLKVIFIVGLLGIFSSCEEKAPPPPVTVIVKDPEELDRNVKKLIRQVLDHAIDNRGQVDDTTRFFSDTTVLELYKTRDFKSAWASTEKWLPPANAMLQFLDSALLYGLFPEDYHTGQLKYIQRLFAADTGASGPRTDAVLWARADVLLSDAFIKIAKDIKYGRLPADSTTLRKDTVPTTAFYKTQFDRVTSGEPLELILKSLEPQHRGYHEIKNGIRNFLDSADLKKYSYIYYPTSDTAALLRAVQQRLTEQGYFQNISDSFTVRDAIKKFQVDHALKPDGKPGPETIRVMNNYDHEKMIRVAITLDRYKLLPDTMPSQYLWVNIPSFYMQLYNADTVKLLSRIVVGKPYTRTPVLTSALSDMITYPQWTVPQSIIAKEILPEAKKDPGYFAKKGFSLVNDTGMVVDPYFVDWSLYKKTIPFKVVQGSGDDNALGVIKFNFSNKYAVYLHDTNQRYYFSNKSRALSHGCVRVQEWQKLARFILANDSAYTNGTYVRSDSVKKWLQNKERKVVAIRKKIPLFIRYFTCDASGGEIRFHDDVYGEDRRLRMKYFAKN